LPRALGPGRGQQSRPVAALDARHHDDARARMRRPVSIGRQNGLAMTFPSGNSSARIAFSVWPAANAVKAIANPAIAAAQRVVMVHRSMAVASVVPFRGLARCAHGFPEDDLIKRLSVSCLSY
jgi:hypothetical protein